jgi:hypothetical protein
MSLVLTSTNRIAWAWLDKMLGQPPSQVDPGHEVPAQAMTPQERQQLLEQAYEDVKGSLIKAIGNEIVPLSHAESAISTKHGIDPLFMSWFLLNSKHWPSMSTKTRRALQAVRSIHMWFGAMPDHWKSMRVPEMEEGRDRDDALREVGDWFVKNAVPRIERLYVNAIWKKSRELVGAFAGRSGRPDSRASLLLMQDFEKRLVGDRFQLKPAVQKVVDLFD